jgi:hypothetical protein
MKLDPERLRTTLSEVEDAIDGPRSEVRVSEREDYPRFYHFDQLVRAGYIRALDSSTQSGHSYIVLDLTMNGHELLKKMRSDTVWSKAKEKISALGGEVPIRVLEKLLDAGWDALIG